MSANVAPIVLLLDVGNTRVKWALARDQVVLESGAFIFAEQGISGFFAQVQNTLQALDGAAMSTIVMAGVANEATLSALREALEQRWGVAVKTIKVAREFGQIKNEYADINQLGVDRWVAVVGAATTHFDGASIVVDVGTAVTVDYLSKEGAYLGGAILPGRELMLTSLNRNTARIQATPLSVSSAFGRNTSECVNVGSQIGLGGAVTAIAKAMLDERPVATQMLVCGGGAELLWPQLSMLEHANLAQVKFVPELIFWGLIALS